jgi:hypothetical protein
VTPVSSRQSLTFAITPDPGYGVKDVLVDRASVGKITSYTFSDISFSHTISVTFGPTVAVGPYYPLTPGASWAYQTDDGHTTTMTILKNAISVNGIRAAQAQYPGGYKEYYTNDASGIRLHGQFSPRAYQNHPGTFTMSPPIVLAPGTAIVGEATHSQGIITLTVPGVGRGYANYSADYTVEGFESITVPAGTFDALKLSFSFTISGSGSSSTQTGTLHLVDGIGQVRQSVTDSGGTGTKFPLTIAPKGSLTLTYNVTFNCVNDPARSTARDPNHYDYRFTAAVDRTAIDGDIDSHTFDDVCPRTVSPPSVTDPYPDGTINDRGCGKVKADGTFGGDVLTDIVAPR